MDSFVVSNYRRDLTAEERAARDAKYAADDRRALWRMYVDGRGGPRNVVTWDPDPRAFPEEVWIDLAGIACECVDGPRGRPCAEWIDGSGEPPPEWKWRELLGSIAVIAVARGADHRAVILDARALIRAVMDRPPENARTDWCGPGELLRRIRNEHEDVPREDRPNLLVCLPAPDTWPRLDEARAGLCSGRMVWASGR